MRAKAGMRGRLASWRRGGDWGGDGGRTGKRSLEAPGWSAARPARPRRCGERVPKRAADLAQADGLVVGQASAAGGAKLPTAVGRGIGTFAAIGSSEEPKLESGASCVSGIPGKR